MTLSQQCVSLDIAKRLKELGVKQDSAFYWINQVKEEMKSRKIVLQPSDSWLVKLGTAIGVSISAFTCSELGEMLPWRIMKGEKSYFLYITKHDDGTFSVHYSYKEGDDLAEKYEDTLADAMGKMLVYLYENGLIKNV